MPDVVRMKAMKPWRNLEFEGHVSIGQEFDAIEDRARELERNGFAVRITIEDKRPHDPPLEFARNEPGGQSEMPRSKYRNTGL